MHILFVTGEYPPMQGGVGAYTAELAAALIAQGNQVSVVTSHQALTPSPPHPLTHLAVHPIITRWDWRIWRMIRALATDQKADWVHVQYQTAAYGMNPAINFAPDQWRRQKQFRVAWTYHDLLVPYLFPKAGQRLRRWVTERPAHTSHQVIVTNEGDRLQLAERGVNAHKIPIGSNIHGSLTTSDDRQLRRRQRNFAHDDLVIGYFGFLNRSKGAANAVRTLHRLTQMRRNVYLLMIGDVTGASDPTNQHYFAEVEQLIIDLGLFEQVRWTGRESEAEVSADLSACDLLFLPYVDGASLRRGTLMAGLAHGCPIVTTTPQAPLPELVDDRDLLYVAPEEPEAAAQTILRLSRDRNLAAQLRTNAFARSQLFTWQSIAEQHRAVYNGELKTEN